MISTNADGLLKIITNYDVIGWKGNSLIACNHATSISMCARTKYPIIVIHKVDHPVQRCRNQRNSFSPTSRLKLKAKKNLNYFLSFLS